MLKSLLRFEEYVARAEGVLLTLLVLLMLGLAVYNVFYRNALVPLQVHVVSNAMVPADSSEAPGTERGPDEPSPIEGGEDSDDFAGGFGGGFDEESESDEDDDFTGGFGGDFEDDSEPKEPDDLDDFAGGFGGDFEASESSDEADDFAGGFDAPSDDETGFGGGFEDESSPGQVDSPDDADEPVEVRMEPRELTGSEAFVVGFVDALKIEWIDVLLRQLVLFVGFLGAMLAARRRKHITIDALAKVIPRKSVPWVEFFTSFLAAGVCVVLAISGWHLVQISLEFPKELVSWANESTFQMVFPVGFGLLAFHFLLRTLVGIAHIIDPDSELDIDVEAVAAPEISSGGDR